MNRSYRPGWKLLKRAAAYVVAAAAVGAVFSLYLRPGFLVVLADQLWACF